MQHLTCHLVNATTATCTLPRSGSLVTTYGAMVVGLVSVFAAVLIGRANLRRAAQTSQASINAARTLRRADRVHESALECLRACDLLITMLAYSESPLESGRQLAEVTFRTLAWRQMAGQGSTAGEAVLPHLVAMATPVPDGMDGAGFALWRQTVSGETAGVREIVLRTLE